MSFSTLRSTAVRLMALVGHQSVIRRTLLLGLVLYLLIGLLYNAVVLYCYNSRNWNVYGGFSLPPLYVVGFFFNLFLWPVYLWASFINSVGIFGTCKSIVP
jgi:hypothetical protein